MKSNGVAHKVGGILAEVVVLQVQAYTERIELQSC